MPNLDETDREAALLDKLSLEWPPGGDVARTAHAEDRVATVLVLRRHLLPVGVPRKRDLRFLGRSTQEL